MIRQTDIDFLEHFGKKGMQWGVKNTPSSSNSRHSVSKPKMSTKKKVAIGVGTVAVVTAGSLLSAKLLKMYGEKKLADMVYDAKHPSVQAQAASARNFLDNVLSDKGKTKVLTMEFFDGTKKEVTNVIGLDGIITRTERLL
jgi:hypothetical protein